MKAADWGKVRPGTFLIYATQWEGVFRAKVLETDIRIYDPSAPGGWIYPYGLTKDRGTVKIQYDTATAIVNLGDLIPYSQSNLSKLEKAYGQYKEYADATIVYRDEFIGLIRDLKE